MLLVCWAYEVDFHNTYITSVQSGFWQHVAIAVVDAFVADVVVDVLPFPKYWSHPKVEILEHVIEL